MKLIIHRGTHQIGGIAAEIRTMTTRIIIDMGEELSLDEGFVAAPLCIPGVTDTAGQCDAILITHNHGDHVGQLCSARDDIHLFMGPLAKDVLLLSGLRLTSAQLERIRNATAFMAGIAFSVGDIKITPLSIDHSACDSYMFLVEADGKRILYTGDFRMHGFRGKVLPWVLKRYVQKVDVLVTEGTTLSRPSVTRLTEHELQQRIRKSIAQYKYVFVLAATTNLERICAISKAVPRGKYFLCDQLQSKLLELIETHWGCYSPLYRKLKITVYNDVLLDKVKSRGFVMMVRDNMHFRNIIAQFDKKQCIVLYAMWDGYRTRLGSTIPQFLSITGNWEPAHTSGHASLEDIKTLISLVSPSWIIPMHTDCPEMLKKQCPEQKIRLLQDGEEFVIS
jgi:ribonuclease J